MATRSKSCAVSMQNVVGLGKQNEKNQGYASEEVKEKQRVAYSRILIFAKI